MAGNPVTFAPAGDVVIQDLNTRKNLTMKLKQAPAALQALRRNIIENANKMVQEMKKYRFNEISEIARVCTALGIERAYLRGLTHSIAAETDIDKYIYRFNLNGGLPFQDKDEIPPTGPWPGGGEFLETAFFYGTSNTILLQCIRQDGEPFVVCNGENIEVASYDPPELPYVAFIPKYREGGADDTGVPWLPDMKCDYLFNLPDESECVTTTDVTSTSNRDPDLNELIPVNVNPFPYTTPNRGFPFLKKINPPPKPLRMVMDGSPVDGETVVLANRFELSGYIEAALGDSITVQIVRTEGLDYPTQIIPVGEPPTVSNNDILIIPPESPLANTGNTIISTPIPLDETEGPIGDPPTVGDPTPTPPTPVGPPIGTPVPPDDPIGDPIPTPSPNTGNGIPSEPNIAPPITISGTPISGIPGTPNTGPPTTLTPFLGDPITGEPLDPNTINAIFDTANGIPLEPNVLTPITITTISRDPITGLPLDPNTIFVDANTTAVTPGTPPALEPITITPILRDPTSGEPLPPDVIDVDVLVGSGEPDDGPPLTPNTISATDGDPTTGNPLDPDTTDANVVSDFVDPTQPTTTIGGLPEPINEFPLFVTPEGIFSTTAVVTDSLGTPYYAGEAYIQRDPITGRETRFTEELYPGDIVEMQFNERIVTGIFYTTGDNKMYYNGGSAATKEFEDMYRDNIQIVIGNVHYAVTSQTIGAGTLIKDVYKFAYTSTYTVTRLSSYGYVPDSSTVITPNKFAAVNQIVSLYPLATNKLLGIVEFAPGYDAEEYFEVGDLIAINGSNYRFKNIYRNTLTGVYSTAGNEINQAISGATLVRSSKITRALPDDEYTQAFALPYRLYYKVKTIPNDKEITFEPNFTSKQPYEGKLYRIGFNIRSTSESPDLKNTGYNVDGVAQFLPDGAATDNSPVFFVPEAATEKVILYDQKSKSQITAVPAGMSSKSVLPVLTPPSALEPNATGDGYFNQVYNYTVFPGGDLNKVIYPASYNPIFDEEEKGILYFTDGDDKYIILETIEDNNPVSHGFVAGDILTIRKVKFDPDVMTDDPYGDLIRYTDGNFTSYMSQNDYDDCGMRIEVADIVNPHRFKILKEGETCSSKANEFFNAYDLDTTYYLTASAGNALEYWAKYFTPVYMDGTTTANSYGEYIIDGQNVERKLRIASKNSYNSPLKHNYNSKQFEYSYWLGSTAINIEVNTNVIEFVPGAIHGWSGKEMTEDGTFVFSIKKDVVHPPQLLDTFLLKVTEFELIEWK